MLQDLKKWDKIPNNVYEDIFKEASDRYSELMSQSENITKKAIQIIFILGVVSAWFAKFLFDNNFCYKTQVSLFFALFALIVYIRLVLMMFPREKITLLGSSVSDSIKQEEELTGGPKQDYDDNLKYKAYLFLKIWRYKKRIESFSFIVDDRAKEYKAIVIWTLLLFSYIVGCVLFIRLLFQD